IHRRRLDVAAGDPPRSADGRVGWRGVSARRDAAGETAQDRGSSRGDEDRRRAGGGATGGRTNPCATGGASWSRGGGGASLPTARPVDAQAVPGTMPAVRAQAISRARTAIQHDPSARAADVPRPDTVAGIQGAFERVTDPPRRADRAGDS